MIDVIELVIVAMLVLVEEIKGAVEGVGLEPLLLFLEAKGLGFGGFDECGDAFGLHEPFDVLGKSLGGDGRGESVAGFVFFDVGIELFDFLVEFSLILDAL